jgi:hypothetical protein
VPFLVQEQQFLFAILDNRCLPRLFHHDVIYRHYRKHTMCRPAHQTGRRNNLAVGTRSLVPTAAVSTTWAVGTCVCCADGRRRHNKTCRHRSLRADQGVRRDGKGTSSTSPAVSALASLHIASHVLGSSPTTPAATVLLQHHH